ncbi:helix-turn-helix domain-containing protein [Curtobacterium sp. ISL-83]|uniref:helix-turn-helix domain-containing protein n=1 Tax=Curtobacterium sp. ISL-83 TaxID=2819145 RepID=UPI001BE7E80D|nr:helix-turn-helix domain-containing protein [Curtobacterium sp. ISL-83]MBT2503860.1 helix-turn-helix domain-containing protein [Curtobacterium sp. ISL-83]
MSAPTTEPVPDGPTERSAVRISIAGTDTDGSLERLAALYGGEGWRVVGPTGSLRLRYAAFGDTGVSLRRTRATGAVRGEAHTGDEVVVRWLDSGRARVRLDVDELPVSPGGPVLFPLDRPFLFDARDWDQRLVHMHRGLVEDVAAEQWDVAPLEGDRISFDHDRAPSTAAVRGLTTAVQTASRTFVTRGWPSLAWTEASRAVVRAFLEFSPPRLAGYDPALLVPERARLRRAVEFIEAHAHEPLTAQSIAAAADVSVRTLQEHFRNVLDTTPTLFLRETRLRRVHEELRAATPEATTVGTVARQWGFVHLGRFAGEYGKRFGEHPSATLRR